MLLNPGMGESLLSPSLKVLLPLYYKLVKFFVLTEVTFQTKHKWSQDLSPNSLNCTSINCFVCDVIGIERVTKFIASIPKAQSLIELGQFCQMHVPNSGAISRPLCLLRVGSLIEHFLYCCNIYVRYPFFS